MLRVLLRREIINYLVKRYCNIRSLYVQLNKGFPDTPHSEEAHHHTITPRRVAVCCPGSHPPPTPSIPALSVRLGGNKGDKGHFLRARCPRETCVQLYVYATPYSCLHGSVAGVHYSMKSSVKSLEPQQFLYFIIYYCT